MCDDVSTKNRGSGCSRRKFFAELMDQKAPRGLLALLGDASPLSTPHMLEFSLF
jgi:hypothetical protein